MFDHVMVDLETLDTRETAVILSIGAVRFSLDELKLGEEFSCAVSPNSCQDYGLTIGADTVSWWMTQPDETRQLFLSLSSLLPNALQDFGNFIDKVPGTKIWGNGATFDNMILRNAYRACSLKYPTDFRNDLCFRTMKVMFPMEYNRVGTHHNSLDDARTRAIRLIDIVGKLSIIGSISKGLTT